MSLILAVLDSMGQTREKEKNFNAKISVCPSFTAKLAYSRIYLYIFSLPMPKEIQGTLFYTASEAADAAGVHRLTLLRWIREGRVEDVPRDRNGWRVFPQSAVKTICEFAGKVFVEVPDDNNRLTSGGVK